MLSLVRTTALLYVKCSSCFSWFENSMKIKQKSYVQVTSTESCEQPEDLSFWIGVEISRQLQATNSQRPVKKKFIDRNWTITTCLLRDSNPNYQCLKITSCRWRPPPRMHSFTATMHSAQQATHTVDTKERELFKCVVAVKECICGGGRHLQDVIFKHW